MTEVLGVPLPLPRLQDPTLFDIATLLKHEAGQGVAADVVDVSYAQRCTYDIPLSVKGGRGVRFMYMRSIEHGLHFLYLSMCFRLYTSNKPLRFDHRLAKTAAPIFFGPGIGDVLVYPPSTPSGRQWNVWHFRLFTDAEWEARSHPRAGGWRGRRALRLGDVHQGAFRVTDDLKLEFKLENDEDLGNGVRLARSVISVITKYQPIGDSHGTFIGGLMGALAGAAIGVLGKDATVAMLEQMLFAAREAGIRVEEAPPCTPPPKRDLH